MSVRLTWVQPEDLLTHELRQAAEDGRDATAIRTRWQKAGGPPGPPATGASPTPAPPHLRTLAEELLDDLSRLRVPTARSEPTHLRQIRSACPHWPAPATTTAPLSEVAGGDVPGRSPQGVERNGARTTAARAERSAPEE
ncbi:ADP-ribosylglycohydrolase family protein, partial [Streptomyces albidochromogenes]